LKHHALRECSRHKIRKAEYRVTNWGLMHGNGELSGVSASETDLAGHRFDFLSTRTRTTVPPRMRRLVLQGARVPGVPIALHLTPLAANRVLPKPPNKGRERPAHAARVGSGEIGRCDQSIRGRGCGADRPVTTCSSISVVLPSFLMILARGMAIWVGPNVPRSAIASDGHADGRQSACLRDLPKNRLFLAKVTMPYRHFCVIWPSAPCTENRMAAMSSAAMLEYREVRALDVGKCCPVQRSLEPSRHLQYPDE